MVNEKGTSMGEVKADPSVSPSEREIEAAARALVESWWEFDSLPPQDQYNAVAERVEVLVAALDRVRDARGDDEVARLRAAAKRVLEADMRGVRDLDALNALEDAAGFWQQGQRRSPQDGNHEETNDERRP